MKLSLQPKMLPLLTLGAGGLGLALRIWYFTTRDAKGLLSAAHFANTLSFLILAAGLGLIILCARQMPKGGRFQKLLPGGLVPAIGAGAGAAGVLYACISDAVAQLPTAGIGLVLGILAAASLVLIGLSRFRGSRPNVYLYALLALYQIVRLLLQVRIWSQETQQTVIFFPLLASIFLMLCTYHYAQLTVRQEGLRPFVFFHQAALLLCLMSVNCDGGLFHLGMAAWLACDLQSLPQPRKQEEG